MAARSPHVSTALEDFRRLQQAARIAHGEPWDPRNPPPTRVRRWDVLRFVVGLAVLLLGVVLVLATGTYPA